MILMNLLVCGSSEHFRFCFCILLLGKIGLGNSVLHKSRTVVSWVVDFLSNLTLLSCVFFLFVWSSYCPKSPIKSFVDCTATLSILSWIYMGNPITIRFILVSSEVFLLTSNINRFFFYIIFGERIWNVFKIIGVLYCRPTFIAKSF